VPTICQRASGWMVGTLRFAHHTNLARFLWVGVALRYGQKNFKSSARLPFATVAYSIARNRPPAT
jgi:hypothetical protein